MAKVIFGNHLSVIVPRKDRDDVRRFYCGVLGATLVKGEDDRDFLRLGDDFFAVLYGDVPDVSEFLRTARSVWLEIKSDDVEGLARKILDFGVRKLDVPDPHLYFQAPGGQCLRLVGIDEDLSKYEGADGEGPTKASVHLAARAAEGRSPARDGAK
jgi:catechol 2,3-dioxygenase-like lactoylglutathione lyase family enzyme